MKTNMKKAKKSILKLSSLKLKEESLRFEKKSE